MPVEVSERWHDETLHKDADSQQWTAVRAFDVVGVLSTELAGQASGPPYGGVPRIGERHPRTPSLAARKVDPVRAGFGLYKVTVNYSIGTFSGEEDPLKQPPKLKWDIGSESLPVDHDPDGNPILNSALDAFDPPQSREFTTIFLTVTRNEPYFDLTKALNFSNRVNSSAFNIKGAGIVAPGQILCRSIKPNSEYIEGVRFVPICYEFELRPGKMADSDGMWDGFKYRLLDQGVRAFYDDKNKGRIYDADQRLAFPQVATTSDIRLDGMGGIYKVALFSGPFVLSNGSASASVSQPGPPKGAIIETTDNAVFLKYKKFLTIDFSGLNL